MWLIIKAFGRRAFAKLVFPVAVAPVKIKLSDLSHVVGNVKLVSG